MVITKTTNYIKKIRVAIYVRVSTKEQAMEGYSVGEQTERLTKFCEAHDWMIVKIYTDAGHSGADTDRPALQEMLQDIRDRKIDKVLVYKLDRLSRSQKDTLKLIEDEFLEHNTDFESMTEKLDTSTPHGRAMIGILAAFAQLEREMITERMSMGMEARMKEGKWRGGAQIPFGYDYDLEKEKLTVNEYEAAIVKDLFKEYTEGTPLHSIAQELRDTGRTLRNGKVDGRNLRYMLRSKTYLGMQKCKNEWIPCNHEALVDQETYDKAQVILDENKRRFEEDGYKTGMKAVSTNLGGLLYCGRCGAKFHKAKTGVAPWKIYENYYCYSRSKRQKVMIKDPNCKNRSYRVEDLDNIIFDQIRKLAVDPQYIHHLKKECEKDDEVKQIHAIEEKIKSINAQMSRFMDLYGLGRYSIEELDQKTKPLADQRTKLQQELKRMQSDTKRITEEKVMKLVESFDEALEFGSLQDRRTIIEQLIDKIIIDGDDITIHWNFI